MRFLGRYYVVNANEPEILHSDHAEKGLQQSDHIKTDGCLLGYAGVLHLCLTVLIVLTVSCLGYIVPLK